MLLVVLCAHKGSASWLHLVPTLLWSAHYVVSLWFADEGNDSVEDLEGRAPLSKMVDGPVI